MDRGIKVCYFTLYLAKGSLYPFLAILLRARGCSLLLVGIAMNTSSIVRLLAGPVLYAVAGKSRTENVIVQRDEPIDELLSRLLLSISYCAVLALVSAVLFAMCPGHPLISAFCVMVMTGSLSLTSLILDSTVVRELCMPNTTASADSAAVAVAEELQMRRKRADDEEPDSSSSSSLAAAGFGETRLFGSLGWGIGAPLQLFVMSHMYRALKNDQEHYKTQLKGSGDVAAWFSVSKQQDYNVKPNPNAANETMLGSVLLFALALLVFVVALKRIVLGAHEARLAERHSRAELAIEQPAVAAIVVPSAPAFENDAQTALSQGADEKVQLDFVTAVFKFKNALLLALLYGVCDGIVSTYLFPFLKESPRNVNTVVLSWIPAVNVLSELPILYFSKRIHAAFSSSPSLASMHVVVLVVWGVRLGSYSVLNGNNAAQIIFLIEMLNGVCFAGALVLCVRHVVHLCGKSRCEIPFALAYLHGAFYGCSSLVVVVAGGLTAELLGTCRMFMLLALVCATVAVQLQRMGPIA